MKKTIALILVVAAIQLKSQTLSTTTVTGKLTVDDELILNDIVKFSNGMGIGYIPAVEETQTPEILNFSSSRPGQPDPHFPYFKKPCNIFNYFSNSYTLPAYQTAFLYLDLIQVHDASATAILNLGVSNGDGIVAVEPPVGVSSNSSKLRLNPGCNNDVYICEGGGFTKIFNDANVNGDFSVTHDATVNGNLGVINDATVGGNLGITGNVGVNGDFSVNNKFTVASSDGKTNVGYQSGAINGSMLNVNVNGGNAIEVFDIGTSGNPNEKINFRVKANGQIWCREVFVKTGIIPDFVFDKKYDLMSLAEREAFIKTQKHLPYMISAKEVEVNDGNAPVGEMMKGILQNTEEITLYLIDLNKKVEALAKENETLKTELNTIKNKK